MADRTSARPEQSDSEPDFADVTEDEMRAFVECLTWLTAMQRRAAQRRAEPRPTHAVHGHA